MLRYASSIDLLFRHPSSIYTSCSGDFICALTFSISALWSLLAPYIRFRFFSNEYVARLSDAVKPVSI